MDERTCEVVNLRPGFGFAEDSQGVRVFFSASNVFPLGSFDQLALGDRVDCLVEQTPRSPHAVRVTRVGVVS